jgi:hypothetical protein
VVSQYSTHDSKAYLRNIRIFLTVNNIFNRNLSLTPAGAAVLAAFAIRTALDPASQRKANYSRRRIAL